MPSRDILTALVRRLIKLVGAPAALDLVRTIHGLTIDANGNVVEYDHSESISTARLLIELYDAVAAELGEPAGRPAGSERPEDLAFLPSEEIGLLAGAPSRLLIVDDHALVRDGLANLISGQPDMQVVGQAGSMREAISQARALRPDVILMDFTLPDGTGDEATRVILSTLPETKIVFLTVHDDDERLFAAISAGAMGYLLKSVRSTDLLSRLRDVVRGDVALSPTIARRILEKLSRQQAPRPQPQVAVGELTEREVEILRLIVKGHTNRQIADALSLSVRTVEYHRSNLMGKLGLHTRADLVRYAAEHGLLD
ncbi:MAG TPA: response regulator transcription factor [Chloroflexaceae bacterium]|nr:response regulator transcription factor [Chloroflexaceae bacterium]